MNNEFGDNYLPDHALLDYLLESKKYKTDSMLAKFLGISVSSLSKIRHKSIKESSRFIILVHEKTNMPIAKIKEMMK